MQLTASPPPVPSAVVESVEVVEVCPVLRVEWLTPDPQLLGGPEEQVAYVLTYTATEGGVSGMQTFSFSSSLMVSGGLRLAGVPVTLLCTARVTCWRVLRPSPPTAYNWLYRM